MLDLRETASGVVGAFCCVYAGLPFEVVKTRLQTQQGAVKTYNGVLHGFRRIAAEEGVASLWKGAVPALSSSIIENSVLFSANGIAKRAVLALHARKTLQDDDDEYQLTTLDEALMGSVAGIFSATAITPAEVIKCKLQFQRGRLGKGEYHGPLDCLQKVFRQEGIPGLFRGYSALLLRDVPFNFFFFGCYEAYTSACAKYLNKESKNDLNPLFILASGGLAGATGWSIVFPADVLKAYMQTASQGTAGGPQTTLGLRGAAKLVYSQHGIHGFYRGWSAAVLRSFPANGSLFLGVEMTHRLFRYIEGKRRRAQDHRKSVSSSVFAESDHFGSARGVDHLPSFLPSFQRDPSARASTTETEGAADMLQVGHSGAREEQEDSGGGGNSETHRPLNVDMHASTSSSDGVISSQQAVAHKPAIDGPSSESTAMETDLLQQVLLEDTAFTQAQDQQQQEQQAFELRAQQKDLELRQLQKTHDEYVKSSCEYEKELEHEVELCERKVAVLEQQTRTLEITTDVVSKKLAEVQAQLASTHTREQALLEELEEMKWKVQRLEQANDELETAARIAQASIEDLEHKNETLLEQNVFLQQEKEELGRQTADVPVAEVQVHPAPASVCSSSFNSIGSSSSFSRSLVSGALNSDKISTATATTAQAGQQTLQQQNLRGKNKAKGRYPDVVESCIHITCRKCRPSHHHTHGHHNHHGRHSRAHRSSSAATSSFEHKGAGAVAEGGKKKAPGVFERLRLRFRAIFDCSSSSSSSSDGKQLAPTAAAKAPNTETATTT